jgi:hypothetical protein
MKRLLTGLLTAAAAIAMTPVPASAAEAPPGGAAFTTPPPVITVSLSTSMSTLPVGHSATLTATTSRDIDPLGLDILIYPDVPGAAVLTVCVQGKTCSIDVDQSDAARMRYVAVVAPDISRYPPPVIWARAYAEVIWFYWVDMWPDEDVEAPVAPGQPRHLRAESESDVGPTPYYIMIHDTTTNTLVRACGTGTECVATITQIEASTHRYVASIARYSSTFPPTDAKSTSHPWYLTWSASGLALHFRRDPCAADPNRSCYTVMTDNFPRPLPAGAVIQVYSENFNRNGTVNSMTPVGLCEVERSSCTLPPVDFDPPFPTVAMRIAFVLPDASATRTVPPPAALAQTSETFYPY